MTGRRRAAGGSVAGAAGMPAPAVRHPAPRWGAPRWAAPVVLALALAGALLAGCGPSGASSTTITLYNGQHVQTTDKLVSAFEQQTGITVQVRSETEDTLADQIATEGAHSPADVVYTENTPAMQYLASKGLLAKVNPGTLARTPSRFNSPTGRWVGVSARVSVLVYNPSLIRAGQLPTSVLQLANPRYRGKLAFAAGETDFQPIVTSVYRTYGRARTLRWLEGIKANSAGHTYADNETITTQVNRGVVAFGVVNQYYWYRLRAQIGASAMHSKITYFAPHDPGYVLDVSPAGVVASSTHKAAAQRFVAFLTSRRGQEIIAHSISFEYPIASGVTTAKPETPFDQLQPNAVTLAQLGDGSTAVSLLKQAGLL